MFHFSTQKYHQVFRHLPACFLFLFLVFFANDSVFAQTSNLLQTKIDYQCEQKTTDATLIEMSQLTEVSIGFDNETLDNQLRDYSFRHKSLSEILKAILVIHGQDFLFIDNGTILTKLKFKKQFGLSPFTMSNSCEFDLQACLDIDSRQLSPFSIPLNEFCFRRSSLKSINFLKLPKMSRE